MSSPDRRLLLSLAIQAVGGDPHEYRTPDQVPGFVDVERYVAFAELAHRARFDSLWMPDLPMFLDPVTSHVLPTLDPVLLMTALAVRVPDIGVVPTVSTSYTPPFTGARQLASLDAMATGRAGINAVASWHPHTAQNYGEIAVPDHDARYGRASEWLDVFAGLSESFTVRPDPALADRGLWYTFDDGRPIDHVGKHFTVRGPVTVPQSRQGRPLISVAGGSPQTFELAARHADVLYTSAVHLFGAQRIRDDVRARSVARGRDSRAVSLMPGVIPVIGSTEQEARDLQRRWAEHAGITLDPVQRIAALLELDPATLHPDRELTPEQMQLPAGWTRPQAFFHSIVEVARHDRLTVAQLAERFQLSVGHRVVVGTPQSVAEQLQDWFDRDVVQGYTLLPQNLQLLETFVDEVTPLLQASGHTPREYDALPLRARFEAADR